MAGAVLGNGNTSEQNKEERRNFHHLDGSAVEKKTQEKARKDYQKGKGSKSMSSKRGTASTLFLTCGMKLFMFSNSNFMMRVACSCFVGLMLQTDPPEQ